MSTKNQHLANESELYFERGGPIQRFIQRYADRWGIQLTYARRIFGLIVIIWVPLLIFALLEGRAMGSGPEGSLLLDIGTYARFFLGLPILILAEKVVGPRIVEAAKHFVDGGFIRPEDLHTFAKTVDRVRKWRESYLAEFLIVCIAFAGSWIFTAEKLTGDGKVAWRSPIANDGTGVSLTGLWYYLIAVPILQFFWYRWLWRLFVWASFLWSMSRLKLRLVATHADQAGGLEFLGVAHTSFSIFTFGLSVVLSAEAASRILFNQAEIESFKGPYVALVIIAEMICLGPLLLFVPMLIRTRLAALNDYSLMLVKYNRAFHEKWIDGKAHADEELLGNADIQSLADLGNSFEFIKRMKVFPFNLRVVIQTAVVTSLPCLPVLLLVIPIRKIVEVIAGAIF